MNIVQFALNLQNNISGPLAQAAQAVKKFLGTTQEAQQATNNLSSTLGKLGSVAAGAFSIYKVAQYGKEVLNLGMEMEQTRVRFETFLGSAQLANDEIERMKRFAEVTPFDTPEVIKADESLVAIGIHGKAAEDVLTKIGNVSSATGAGLQDLVSIYTKANQVGKVNGEILHQLRAVAPATIPAMAKAMGTSVENLYKMSEKGLLSFKDIDKAMDYLGGKGGKWAGLMERQSKTVEGRLSNLKGTIYNMASALGERLGQPFGALVDKASDALAWVSTHLAQLGNVFKPLGAAIQPLVESFKRIWASLGITGDAGTMLQKVFNAIGNTIQFLAPLITAVAKLVGNLYEATFKVIRIFSDWIAKNDELKARFLLLYNVTKTVFGAIGEIASKVFGGIVKSIDGILNADFSKLGSGLKDIVSAPIQVAFDANTYKPLSDAAPTLKDFFAPDSAASKARDAAQGTKASLGSSASSGAKDKTKTSTKIGDVSGTKPTNVYLTVQRLIGVEHQTNTNIKDAARSAGNLVLEQLTAALSDVSLLTQKQ